MYNNNELDLLNIISIIAQFQNMDSENEYYKYIKGEIQKLHEENEKIMKQNEEILRLLRGEMF